MEASNRNDLNGTIGNSCEEAQAFNNGRKKLGVPLVQRRIVRRWICNRNVLNNAMCSHGALFEILSRWRLELQNGPRNAKKVTKQRAGRQLWTRGREEGD
ncbi:uncharacterized protein FFB20_14301 [Fusarium fujikuroi]|uniref:Uncharacterized protein n=1 Tax=Gibberella fujikuroi (strain CBS 195.34 / IMI 58289 / NRRL A-6831) TaxID=1279085 RepID=S0E881_GIBF5|nr:uncharacterized protein FFUJ_07490 [Fusarium fujikuroi IMI 58289]KLO86279.1 uncharacterized protein Y057_098 [Fusarium fujikuroi]KLO94131.1 uncharacterized protein LW93_11714 [Fusarium fujikuroi]KLP20347.1 uncharacterized protein LW94_6207 [Fusarium fujikuroi]CCT68683.1 uncharacterized protein FFUJ_07490 [Fusarium fujikuroi IMI 58289]SCN78789.1 uncharacterized protein FFC1_03051 [Fusarium fujikuroi]